MNNAIEPAAAKGVGTEMIQEGGTANMETVYTFRRLNSTDTFLMCKIISKIGINEFVNCFGRNSVIKAISGGSTDSIVGISVMLEVANVICAGLPKAENEIYQMLSNTSNLTVDQVKDLDFVCFFSMIVDFIKKEEFRDFLSVASKLLKRA